MSQPTTWVGGENVALLTDLYQLTMAEAYWREGMTASATFSLFVRRLPPSRNYILACGLEDALAYLESLRFSSGCLGHLERLNRFAPDFLRCLESFRFQGEVDAVAEGTPLFAGEPLLEVTASLPQAQLVESALINQVHLQTVMASKAARVVQAARGRPVIDFGLRRMHGADAALRAVRAFAIAGVDGTSHVLAGSLYGLPVKGTMAHSYVQAHRSEKEAFRAFAAHRPGAVLLVDTYDLARGVQQVVDLARDMKSGFRISAVRLDSGDLAAGAREARRILDAGGLPQVRIVASGDLDEWAIARLLEEHAPVDAFGVGTRMGVSEDAPALEMVYKMTRYAGRGRVKLSRGKAILPGRKQVFRQVREGRVVQDILARREEQVDGQPLLFPVMKGGRRSPSLRGGLAAARERARSSIAALPGAIQALQPAVPPFPVQVSAGLAAALSEISRSLGRGNGDTGTKLA
ncbi:MAG: nicotinate phosphoribosyltransferase [Acidobacteriota bacterium]